MRVAVVGASGYVGSHLVPRLIAEGHTVRAVARRRAVLEGRGWAGVEAVEADALDRASLERALVGALAVPSTAGMTLDIGGPETLSYRDLPAVARRSSRGLSRKRKVRVRT